MLLMLGLLGLHAAPPAAAKQVNTTIPAQLIFIERNNGPFKCVAKTFIQFEHWETASFWELRWTYQGKPERRYVATHSTFDKDADATPPAGYHWLMIAYTSKDGEAAEEHNNCGDMKALQEARYADPSVVITVEDDDPKHDEDPKDPPKPPPPPPSEVDLTPPDDKPPPKKWPFDPKRPTVTLVDCKDKPAPSRRMRCKAAVWDARPDDPGASAPRGRVNWFAPNGTLFKKQCTLRQSTEPVSICGVDFRPSPKTADKAKQPVQAAYQGSGKHRPSSGIDGIRPMPVPMTWKTWPRTVKVGMYCGGQKTCRGTAALNAKRPTNARLATGPSARRNPFVRIGQVQYQIPSGQTNKVTIVLNRRGRTMLRNFKRKLPGRLVLAPKYGSGLKQTLRVRV